MIPSVTLPSPSDPTTAGLQMVSMTLTFLTTIGVAWIGYLTATAKTRADAAAERAEAAQQKNTRAVQAVTTTLVATVADTKQTLAATTEAAVQRLDQIASVAQATHTLVNSNYGMSLLSTLNALKTVRALTREPGDIKAADEAVKEATRLYEDHVSKQAVVDQTNPVGPFPSNVEKPRPT